MSRLWFACLLLLNNRCRHSRWVFLGPCTRVHGQGSPTIRVGKGWRGRRELAPRCSATQLGASQARPWPDTARSSSSEPHTPHATRHTHTRTTHKTQHTTQQQPRKFNLGRLLLPGEEPPRRSGELNHALSQEGGPTQSHPLSSGHHISMEH